MPRLSDRARSGVASAASFRPFVAGASEPTGFLDVVPAVWSSFLMEDHTLGEVLSKQPYLMAKTQAAFELTGDDYYHPSSFQRRLFGPQPPASGSTWRTALDLEERLEARSEELAKLRMTNPSRAHELMPKAEYEAEIADKARQARELRDSVLARAGPWAGFFGSLVGAGGAAITDPVNIASMRYAAARGAGVLKAALVGGGVGLTSEAFIQSTYVVDYKAKIGSPYSFRDAAFNTFAAGVFGGIFEGALRGVGSRLRTFRERGTVLREYKDAVAQGKLEPTPETEGAAAVVEAHQDLATASPLPDTPAGNQAHVEAVLEASAAVKAGRGADVSAHTEPFREHIEAQTPANVLSMDPDAIEVDAATFQFKGGGDAKGVTDKLGGVSRWDPTKGGLLLVYEKTSGKVFVVDGHHRLELAKRAKADGQEVAVNVMVLRESAGVSPSDARLIAAARNIAEGNATALDAAKVIREAGSIEDMNLPPRSALVRDAKGLARLGDEAFREVINRRVPEPFAAIVGNRITDPAAQLEAIGQLRRAKVGNAAQAELMVDQMVEFGFQKSTQVDLFGASTVAESLIAERAKVLDLALRRLRRDKALFASLVEREGVITEAGNVLDPTANTGRLNRDELALGYLSALANRKGPIGSAVTEAARELKAGASPRAAADKLLEAVRRELHGKGAKAPKAKDVVPDAAVGAPVRVSELEPAQAIEARRLFLSEHHGSVDDLYQVAATHQEALRARGAELAGLEGVTHLDVPLKGRDRATHKMSRKNYQDASGLTDVVRTGFAVDSAKAADSVAKALAETFELLDEGWVRNGGNWMDRKLLVRFGDGTVGEVQIREAHMHAAKETGGGLKLYEQRRDLEVGGVLPEKSVAKAAELEASMAKLYGDAMAQADPVLRKLYEAAADAEAPRGTGKRPAPKSALENEAIQEALDIGRPESRTSVGEAVAQLSPSRGTKKAVSPAGPETTTAGLPSQSKKASEAPGGAAKAEPGLFDDLATTRDSNADLDSPEGLADITAEYEALVKEYGDQIEVPSLTEVDAQGNPIMRKATDVIEELEAERAGLDDLAGCMKGAA